MGSAAGIDREVPKDPFVCGFEGDDLNMFSIRVVTTKRL